jgi:nucleoid-associated protein YgaU
LGARRRFHEEPAVVTRRQKLTAASVVLLVGFGLAWPLRRGAPLDSGIPGVLPLEAVRPVVNQAANMAPTSPVQPLTSTVATATTLPAATPAAGDPFTGDPAAQPDAAGNKLPFTTVSDGGRLAMQNTEPAESHERVHVVHEGDSLDRLAKRYLGDEGRALEIYDANRELLKNPHVLPLGAELRIPASLPAAETASAQ